MSIGKRSTLAKIWGEAAAPQAPRILRACTGNNDKNYNYNNNNNSNKKYMPLLKTKVSIPSVQFYWYQAETVIRQQTIQSINFDELYYVMSEFF